MEGFALAGELLTKMLSAARQYKDVYDKDGAAARRVENMLDQAAAAFEEENSYITAVISELKQEVALGEQLVAQLQSSGVGEDELERLRRMLDQSRKYEEQVEDQTRVLKEEVNNIENCFKAAEAKKQELQKLDELHQRNRNELALYAQVTRLIPNLHSSKVAGTVLDKERRLEKEFELDPAVTSEFEICRSLWHIDE